MSAVVVHYNEIGLKGRNQPLFLRRLEANLLRATTGAGVRRVLERSGRMVLALTPEAYWPTLRERVRDVLGVANFSFAERTGLDLDALKAAVGRGLQGRQFASFRVATRRAYKPFPLNSEEINRELGASVVEQTHARVDLDHAELTIHVEVLPRDIYFAFGREKGPGGLPVGVSGTVVALLSGGLDSPVAAYRLMKRGCRVVFVHFHSQPFQDGTSRQKAVDLVQSLTRFQYHSRLHFVPFADVQRAVVATAPGPLRIILYRRFMARIAREIARREEAKALVTGESLGQVASQTLENLAVIEAAVDVPLLRPLIGSDKEEIVQQARALGTYEISILPDQDCCSLFTPQHPATFSRLDEVESAEARLPVADLVAAALRGIETQESDFPPAAAPARAGDPAEASLSDAKGPAWTS
jgi:tRNA uracil 4-sulfurtransferase